MDTTPEPSSPVEEFVKRAERLASGAEHHIPSWLRPGDPGALTPGSGHGICGYAASGSVAGVWFLS